ncbi:unnamed protein product [Cunninghamella blakesleeana]
MAKAFLFYFGLLCLRWMMASLPGYIHPDEYFQLAEVTARHILQIDTFIPWEFQSEHAARSISIPFITTGFPFWIITTINKWLCSSQEVYSTLTLFLLERSVCFLLTLITDYVIYSLCQRLHKDEILPLLFAATSQVTLVYCTRPFSNSVEAAILCISILQLVSFDMDHTSGFLLGCLLTTGIFTRITFILYGFPIGLAFLYVAKKQNRLIQSGFNFLFGASIIAGIVILTDSLYYGGLTFIWKENDTKITLDDLFQLITSPTTIVNIRWKGSFIFTFLNNLLYNTNADNLALHGLHPRYTHILVNFPLLYGPLAFTSLYSIWTTAKKIRYDFNAYLYYTMVSIVLISIIGLSLIPHQEARFLVPMLIPLIMIYTWDQEAHIGSVLFLLLWLSFNLVTSFVFGNLHQAGIVPAMSFIQRQTMGINGCQLLSYGDISCNIVPVGSIDTNGFNITTHIIFYKTYMPPRHLLSFPLSWKDGPLQISIEDVAGNQTLLYDALKRRQGTVYRKHNKDRLQIEFTPSKISEEVYERTLLIVPNVIPLPNIPGQRYMLISNYEPHVNFDEIGEILKTAKKYDSPISLASLNIFVILSDDKIH